MAANYSAEPRGKLYTETYKLYLKNEFGQTISPFHDIPLTSSENVYNMVVEVPRWTNAKMEISKSEPMNPIVQDVKKGKVRFVGNVFPHKGYIWNYGAFPQTWEDPRVTHPGTNASGDNDPLDVCDISSIIVPMGSVIQVKVLGILAMIDEGETDWKVMAINTEDPLAAHMEDITDVEKYKPGLLHATLEWFKYYKVPDGKPTNAFGYNNKFRNREFALEIINETHGFWKKLVGSETEERLSEEECGGIQRLSVSVNDSPYLVLSEQAQEHVDNSAEHDSEPASIVDSKASEFYFIKAAEVPSEETDAVAVTSAEVNGDAHVENGDANGESSEVSAAEPNDNHAVDAEAEKVDNDESVEQGAGDNLHQEHEDQSGVTKTVEDVAAPAENMETNGNEN